MINQNKILGGIGCNTNLTSLSNQVNFQGEALKTPHPFQDTIHSLKFLFY